MSNLLNVRYIGESTISDNLENNIVGWLNYSLLTTSAFFNIPLATSGSHGGNASRLRLASNPSYTNGQVWESFRKQWIWQSGIENTIQPIQVSGVYVNGAFKPSSGVGPYAHKIDYPNGRVVFNSAISTSSSVTMEYSCNYYQIYNVDSPWWRDVQRNSFRIDDSTFLTSASGFWAKPPEMRVQLPAIIVQATQRTKSIPYQIGDLTQIQQQDFKFYIITETNRDLKWICDVIRGQTDANHALFDSNKLMSSGVYPINMDTGTLNPTTMNYPDLVKNYPANKVWNFKKVQGNSTNTARDIGSAPIFTAVLDCTIETWTN